MLSETIRTLSEEAGADLCKEGLFCLPASSRSPGKRSRGVFELMQDGGTNNKRVITHIRALLSRIPISQQKSIISGLSPSVYSGMTYQQLAEHIISLRTEYIQKLARPVVLKFYTHPRNFNIFNDPVDPVLHNLQNYFEIIQHPMDLGTIKSRLNLSYYESLSDCFDDVRRVFNNAITFNGPESFVGKAAKELLAEFETDVVGLEDKNNKHVSRTCTSACLDCSGEMCLLCGDKCLRLENASFFCQGSCAQKIKKAGIYFVSKDALNVWCQKCHQSLPTVLGNYLDPDTKQPVTLLKKDLLKRRHDEQTTEPWVECDRCGFWLHQICALYTDAAEHQPGDFFSCPICILEAAADISQGNSRRGTHVIPVSELEGDFSINTDRDLSSSTSSSVSLSPYIQANPYDKVSDGALSARSLPATKLSEFLEALIKELLTAYGCAQAAETITIRVTSNIERSIEVNAPLQEFSRQLYGTTLPGDIPYRQKCIQLYQDIDGISVVLFSLYVHEFDRHCPAPNTSTVYIAYLDSTDYFRPAQMRSFVYQEIVVGYLLWAKARGFQQCHIWACPPQRGDNFIFWCHPVHQRTPSRDRLNAWYHSILTRAKKLGIHQGVSHLWNSFFAHLPCRSSETSTREASKRNHSSTATVAAMPRKYSKNNQGQRLQSKLLTNSDDTSNTNDNSSDSQQPSNNDSMVLDCGGHNHSQQPYNSSQLTIKSESSSSSTVTTSKVFPPIFEGDYWILEINRFYHAAAQRWRNAGQQSTQHTRTCRNVLKMLLTSPLSLVFRDPVDPIALHIPTYFDVVKQPMDLGTVRQRLESDKYAHVLAFAQDVRLTLFNAQLFNPPGHPIYQQAETLLKDFEKRMADIANEARKLFNLTCLDGIVLSDDDLLQRCKLASCVAQRHQSLKTESMSAEPKLIKSELTQPRTVLTPGSRRSKRHRESSEAFPFPESDKFITSETIGIANIDKQQTQKAAEEEHSRQHQIAQQSPTSVLEGRKEELFLCNPHTLKFARAVTDDLSRYDLVAKDLFKQQEQQQPAQLSQSTIDGVEEVCPSLPQFPPQRSISRVSPPSPQLSTRHQNHTIQQFNDTLLYRSMSEDQDTNMCDEQMDVDNNTSNKGNPAQPAETQQPTINASAVAALSATLDKHLPTINVTSFTADLSKSIQRLNDDLFVLRFAPTPMHTTVAANIAASELALSQTQNQQSSFLVPPSSVGTGKAKKAGNAFVPKQCLQLLMDIARDTIDPDPLMHNALVDSRHTFLELSQFRHMQFDSLRRAKHSSLLLVYHQLHHAGRRCGPVCSHCHLPIRHLRWHCEQCAGFEICQTCMLAKEIIAKDRTSTEENNDSGNAMVVVSRQHSSDDKVDNADEHGDSTKNKTSTTAVATLTKKQQQLRLKQQPSLSSLASTPAANITNSNSSMPNNSAVPTPRETRRRDSHLTQRREDSMFVYTPIISTHRLHQQQLQLQQQQQLLLAEEQNQLKQQKLAKKNNNTTTASNHKNNNIDVSNMNTRSAATNIGIGKPATPVQSHRVKSSNTTTITTNLTNANDNASFNNGHSEINNNTSANTNNNVGSVPYQTALELCGGNDFGVFPGHPHPLTPYRVTYL